MKVRSLRKSRPVNATAGIVVEHGYPVPIPERGRRGVYPWESMKVGDSFLFPSRLTKRACYSAAFNRSQRTEKKYRTHATAEGYRCWRIA